MPQRVACAPQRHAIVTHWYSGMYTCVTVSGFVQKLASAWRTRDSMVCVGLDPELHRLPAALHSSSTPYFDFCQAIVDATAPYVCAFKPQVAHFSAVAAEPELQQLIEYIHNHHPDVPVILDAKRGDIGSTARLYAREAFERYDADAVTVNPYLGFDAVQPYLEFSDRGVILLCRTSNPGSALLQNLATPEPLYLKVAEAAAQWNSGGQLMLVAGATWPEELRRIRDRVGDMPLLVPGVGAQGGDVDAVVRNGATADGRGLVINSARAIIFAYDNRPDGRGGRTIRASDSASQASDPAQQQAPGQAADDRAEAIENSARDNDQNNDRNNDKNNEKDRDKDSARDGAVPGDGGHGKGGVNTLAGYADAAADAAHALREQIRSAQRGAISMARDHSGTENFNQ